MVGQVIKLYRQRYLEFVCVYQVPMNKLINPDTNKKNLTVRDYPGYQSVLYLSSLTVRRGMALTNPLLAR